MQEISYKINTASIQDVHEHLLLCNEDFYPPLNQTVDVLEYSRKIVENAVTFESWRDGILIGLLACYFNDLKNFTGFITNVSTIKIFKGKGIASTLIRQCVGYAKKNKFNEVLLEVFRDNEPAINLYRKFNFIQIGKKNDLIVMKIDITQQ